MTIIAFCAVNSKQANTPGVKTFNARLVTLSAPAGTANPNAGVFAGTNPAVIELPNLTAAAAAEFDAGDMVTVTITKTPPAAGS